MGIAGLYYYTAVRFEAEFLPSLVLLAMVGILGLERALADQPVWCRVSRGLWILLLGSSVAFNLLATVVRCAEVHDAVGSALEEAGESPEAIRQFQQAVRINPNSAEAHNDLALALESQNKLPEAVEEFEQAVRSEPDFVEAHFNLGIALAQQGKVQDARQHFEQALRLRPDLTPARDALAHLPADQ